MSGGRSSSPQRVADILTAAVPALSERLVEVAIRREWTQVVPAGLGRRSEPGDLRNGTLEVRVDNSPWLHELSMRSDEVLAALAARYGSPVRALRFRLATLRGDDSGRTAPAVAADRPAPPSRLTAQELREVDATTAILVDPQIARALRRLLIKDRLARRRTSAPPGRERRT